MWVCIVGIIDNAFTIYITALIYKTNKFKEMPDVRKALKKALVSAFVIICFDWLAYLTFTYSFFNGDQCSTQFNDFADGLIVIAPGFHLCGLYLIFQHLKVLAFAGRRSTIQPGQVVFHKKEVSKIPPKIISSRRSADSLENKL